MCTCVILIFFDNIFAKYFLGFFFYNYNYVIKAKSPLWNGMAYKNL